MSKNDKIAAFVAGGVGLVVLIWMMYMRRASPSTLPTSNSPGSIGTAYPGTNPWNIAANGLPSSGAVASPNSCCGCSSGSSGIFTSLGNMLNYFQSKSSSMFDDYQKQVYSAYPDSVTQYFNNPAGASMSSNSREIMR